uniref:PPUP9453 n=1 Tax=Poeciliopsis prolifica TaxID=188132 RepID=A0A0S7ENS5_9TELE
MRFTIQLVEVGLQNPERDFPSCCCALSGGNVCLAAFISHSYSTWPDLSEVSFSVETDRRSTAGRCLPLASVFTFAVGSATFLTPHCQMRCSASRRPADR